MKRTYILLLASVIAVALSLESLAQQKQGEQHILRAGAATSNITPPIGEAVVGGFVPYPSKHVHDELHARCLVLDDGHTKLAFAICDNVGIPREVFDTARKTASEATGIPEHNILMSATHTHSATSARGANRLIKDTELSSYQQFLATRISDGLRRAANNLEPAKIGWGSAQEPSEVFNRRWRMSPGPHLNNPFGGTDQVRMNPPRADKALLEPAGPTDPEIAFISVQSTDGRPIALLADYSLHYVGGVRGADISADYFAIFADRIQELLGADRLDPPFVGILCNGTSGDVNNINFREKGVSHKPYEKMREVANKVAQRVYDAQKSVKFQEWVPLSAAWQELTLGARKPTPEQIAYAEQVLKRADKEPSRQAREEIYARRLQSQLQAPSEVTVPIQAFKIGELGIAAIPFEVFTEIGLEIKASSALKPVFTISLANGSYGYLPTPRQHALGGYETWLGTNVVEIKASDKISATALELLKGLAAKP